MRIPKEDDIELLIANELVDYCNQEIFPFILKDKVIVQCSVSRSNEFNAVVTTLDGINFTIKIGRGIVKTFIDVVNTLENNEIDNELTQISTELFCDAGKRSDIYIALVYGATIFVILHELAHIFRGHLHFFIRNRLNKTPKLGYNFREISKKKPINSDIFNGYFLMLAELDADASSLNVYLQISLEVFAILSEHFEPLNPDWRASEIQQWRNATNKVAYYSASLALSMIEVKRGRSASYPMPLTRFFNISDTYKQNVYDQNGILTPGHGGGIQYFQLSDDQDKLRESLILMPFLHAIDVMTESAKILGKEISNKFGEEELDMYKKLFSDFWALQKSVSPDELESEEGIEYRNLRNMRPDFYEEFSEFIIFVADENDTRKYD